MTGKIPCSCGLLSPKSVAVGDIGRSIASEHKLAVEIIMMVARYGKYDVKCLSLVIAMALSGYFSG